MQKRKKSDITNQHCYLIGKYTSDNETASAQRKFRSSHGAIGESTIRLFKKKYEAMIKDAARKLVSPKKLLQRGNEVGQSCLVKSTKWFMGSF